MTTLASLRDSLTYWTGFPKIGREFGPRHIHAVAAWVTKTLGDVQPKPPSSYDLEALYRRVLESWRRHHSIEQISARDLRRLPWIMFYLPRNAEGARKDGPTGWLGAKPRVVLEYGAWLSEKHRTRSVLALLHEFLRIYPAGLPTFHDLRTLLQKAIKGSSSPPPSLQQWKQRCVDFGLLETNGSLPFVQKLVSTAGAPDHILYRAGLDAGLAQCGFLESGIRKYLPTASALLTQDGIDTTQIHRLLAILEFDGKLRFDERSMRVEVASTLLQPFVERQPDIATKDLLQSFFLRHFGHPRLPSGKHHWSGVPDDTVRVLLRWLVERVLDKFFMLVKDTALDKHWRYREAFWKAFLRRDLIDDVWFLLGAQAAHALRRMKEDDGATGTLHGAQSDQSVLLLRMPGMTIAEWSHNGKCRIWLGERTNAPKLYQPSYNRYDLTREADFEQVHHGSDSGRWQDQVAEWMRANTGVTVYRNDYILNNASRRRRRPGAL